MFSQQFLNTLLYVFSLEFYKQIFKPPSACSVDRMACKIDNHEAAYGPSMWTIAIFCLIC